MLENEHLIAVVNPDREGLVNETAIVKLISETKDGRRRQYLVDEIPANEFLREHAIYTDHIAASTTPAENSVVANTAAILSRSIAELKKGEPEGARLAERDFKTRDNVEVGYHIYGDLLDPRDVTPALKDFIEQFGSNFDLLHQTIRGGESTLKILNHSYSFSILQSLESREEGFSTVAVFNIYQSTPQGSDGNLVMSGRLRYPIAGARLANNEPKDEHATLVPTGLLARGIVEITQEDYLKVRSEGFKPKASGGVSKYHVNYFPEDVSLSLVTDIAFISTSLAMYGPIESPKNVVFVIDPNYVREHAGDFTLVGDRLRRETRDMKEILVRQPFFPDGMLEALPDHVEPALDLHRLGESFQPTDEHLPEPRGSVASARADGIELRRDVPPAK